MPTQLKLPLLGESVIEATISKWLKARGDTVKEYEALVEVNTDKVDTEIPSPITGVVLDILVPEGTSVKVGTVLAILGQPDESHVTWSPAHPVTPSPAHPLTSPPSSPKPSFLSPVVAKIAKEQNVDLRQLSGTGLGGRITKKDILAYIEARQAAPQPAEPDMPAPVLALSLELGDTLLPLSPMRRRIAEHMVLSKTVSPHVTTVMEVDMSRVAAHREANKAAFARDGVNLTYTAYFVAAAAAALKAFPMANSSWSDDGILVHRAIHIGMAVSLGDEGLIVPVIKNADDLSLLGLARAVNDLAARARAHKLLPDEVKGGTFSITNHGTGRSLFATPVINQPQCGILGVGAIQKRAVVISDTSLGDVLAIRPMVYLSFTFDHRILDGASADGFLGKVVDILHAWA